MDRGLVTSAPSHHLMVVHVVLGKADDLGKVHVGSRSRRVFTSGLQPFRAAPIRIGLRESRLPNLPFRINLLLHRRFNLSEQDPSEQLPSDLQALQPFLEASFRIGLLVVSKQLSSDSKSDSP